MEMNKANKNGTSKELAAFIPATTMMKAAEFLKNTEPVFWTDDLSIDMWIILFQYSPIS